MKRERYINQNIFKILISMFFLSQTLLISNRLHGAAPGDPGNAGAAEKLFIVKGAGTNESDTISTAPRLDREIPVLYGTQKWNEITGAISFIKGDKVANVSGTNNFNSLTGLIPGLLVVQSSSFPGNDGASLSIRGQRTFGPSVKSPLIILDGVETEIAQISPYDIESVTVLKDAISTAMYGLRATNGIILITSRRGKAGDIKINLNSQTSIRWQTRLPEFLSSADYATLYNEAAINEGSAAKYLQTDIDAFRAGTDPIHYPDHNWVKEYMSDYSIQTRNNLDISGGNENVRYFFSAGYVKNNGLFVTEKDLNTYNTNSALNLSDIHTNVDFKASERLSVNVDLKAKFDKRNNPGSYVDGYETNLFNDMIDTPPLAYPVLNADGSLGGNTDYMNNLYGQLNNSGYSIWERTYLSGDFEFNYNLDVLLEGLSLKGKLGFSNFVDHVTNRSKDFAVYQSVGDTVYNKIGLDTKMSSTNAWSNNNTHYSGNIGLEYARSFGNSSIKGMLLFDRQEYIERVINLPHIIQGLQGSVNYAMSSKYLIDFAFSYQGNEQFPKGSRYGFFPAIGLGWILSKETFMDNLKSINYLKIRASAGQTGNEFSPFSSGTPYFAQVENYVSGGGNPFGVNPTGDGGFYEGTVVNNLITWEKALKYNVGVDAAFLDNKLSLTVDYFYEKNRDILISGVTSGLFGADFWYPEGIVENQGIEGVVSWNHQVGDFSYFISSNATFAKDKIIEQKEQQRAYDWMIQTGNRIGTKYGYVFDRFFTEADNFSALPDQSMLGQVHPGDLKYKDLNGDNIIDNNDQMKIGEAGLPEIYYGLNGGVSFKGIDFSVLFQGVSSTEKLFSGSMVYEFIGGKGNVTDAQLGRWTPGSGQDATYPRLAIQQFSNSRASSTFWVKDCSYLRLKTIELGYSLPKSVIEKVHLNKVRVYTNAYNLLTWSKLKFPDPETSSYGINSIVSVGLNIGF